MSFECQYTGEQVSYILMFALNTHLPVECVQRKAQKLEVLYEVFWGREEIIPVILVSLSCI